MLHLPHHGNSSQCLLCENLELWGYQIVQKFSVMFICLTQKTIEVYLMDRQTEKDENGCKVCAQNFDHL